MDYREKAIVQKNPELKKIHEKYELRYKMARLLMRARLVKGITQAELARRMGTKQPAIARIENASQLPSLEFLFKVAKALDTVLIEPNFAFLEELTVVPTADASTNLFKECIKINPPYHTRWVSSYVKASKFPKEVL